MCHAKAVWIHSFYVMDKIKLNNFVSQLSISVGMLKYSLYESFHIFNYWFIDVFWGSNRLSYGPLMTVNTPNFVKALICNKFLTLIS